MVDTLIPGATALTYTLVEADVGHSIYCRVTGTNSVGASSANSNTVGPIVAAPTGVFTFIAMSAAAGGANTFSTTAIDTTGANLLVVAKGTYNAPGASVLTDSKGNTWTALSASAADGGQVQFYYCINPASVGSGHTITLTGSAIYGGVSFAAFASSGTPIFDGQVQLSAGSPTGLTASIDPITPTADNALILSVVSIGSAGIASSIDSGFTMNTPSSYAPGAAFGNALAYLMQSTAAAVDPTWTLSESCNWNTTLVAFKPG